MSAMVRWSRKRLAEVVGDDADDDDDDDDDDAMTDSIPHQTSRPHLSPAPALTATLCRLVTGSSPSRDLNSRSLSSMISFYILLQSSISS